MKPALYLALPLMAVGLMLAETSDAQPYTVYAPPATFAGAPGCQTCPPPVPPPVVVQPAPRRCCILRFCDWLCGRNRPQTTIAAMPIVQAPPVTCAPVCAPTCAPACGCSPCESGGCPTGSCGTMPAPSLSNHSFAPSTYAASSPMTYQQNYPVQQASYAQPASSYAPRSTAYAQPTSTYAQPARSYTPPQSTYAQPASSYTQPVSTYAQPAAPVRQVNYTAQGTPQSYSLRAPHPTQVQWSSGR